MFALMRLDGPLRRSLVQRSSWDDALVVCCKGHGMLLVQRIRWYTDSPRQRLVAGRLTSTFDRSTDSRLELDVARKARRIPLLVDSPRHAGSGIVHVISLAQMALAAARARAAKKRRIVARLQVNVEEQETEIRCPRRSPVGRITAWDE